MSRSVANEAVANLSIHLMLGISGWSPIGPTWRRGGAYRRLRVRRFKGDVFERLSFLCGGRYVAGILSILHCLGGTLFVIEVNEVSLHG